MKRSIILFLAPVIIASIAVQGQTKHLTLPNGWGLSPAGDQITLGDLPLNLAIAPGGNYAAVTNNGQGTQSIQIIDIRNRRITDTREVRKSWLGIVFGSGGKFLYLSGGNDNCILKFKFLREKLVPCDTFFLGKPWPEKISPAGIAVDEKSHRLFVVTKENNSLYVIDTKEKRILKTIPLGGEGYTCILSPDMKHLYCSCWGCGKVVIMNTRSLEAEGSVQVGNHPNDMVLDNNRQILYVSNSNDNSVSVIDLQKKKVVEVLNAALYPDSPQGSTTNSVALSDDNKTLYVANADNNCLTVFDVSNPGKSNGSGFIPTGWYPTCVRVSGDQILVVNGKGLTSLANPQGPNPARRSGSVVYQHGEEKKPAKEQYIASLFPGALSIIATPGEKNLSAYSKQVYSNVPYRKDRELVANFAEGNPIPHKVGDPSPIRYVFYVIKENRTYDQVLGDIAEGNGDTSLVLFGKKYTPNQHAVANEFVLLDNFYVDGEVSADGHNWSMGAYATDYLEKTWPTAYGDRGGLYDSEGMRAVANNKNGFLWDDCKRNGISYRTYGEFADNYKPNIPALEGHYNPRSTSWDTKVKDTTRFSQWRQDFDSLLAIGKVPQLSTIRFPNDHTEGLKAGRPTPYAHVADNDLAVGMLIEYLGKSPIWKQCAVFILEDDAQNGPDHVDAHRSTAYIAGGLVKSSYIDHTPYSTSSFLRTIELILGIPPMSQYDAAAEATWRCFDAEAIHPPFTSRPAGTDLSARNTAFNQWQKKSEEFNFTMEDRVPDQELNEIIWVACKGVSGLCPPPVHAAFVKTVGGKYDDD